MRRRECKGEQAEAGVKKKVMGVGGTACLYVLRSCNRITRPALWLSQASKTHFEFSQNPQRSGDSKL